MNHTDASKASFVALLGEMLFEFGTPDVLIKFLISEQRKIYSDYDMLNPHDQQILNNKVVAINQLVVDRPDEHAELSVGVKQKVLNIMSRKG